MPADRFLFRLGGAGRAACLAVLLAFAVPAAIAAGEATPVAPDLALESRVQSIAHTLRCLVCQNQTIADSNAPLAVDLRNQVREQLAAGRSEAEVLDFMVARYGEFVLFKPRLAATTLFLWFGPGLLLVGGLVWLFLRLRRRQAEPVEHLSAAEHSAALALLKGDQSSPEEPRS